MRGHRRWAWAVGAIAAAGLAAGLAFAVIDGGGTDESDLAAGGSTSPSVTGNTPGSIRTLEPTLTPKPADTATPPVPGITPCSAGCPPSGIEGRVLQSPICPVETDPPQPECAPRPYQATVIVWSADHSAQVAKFTADEDGRFRVPLEPGDYSIEPQGEGRFPMPPRPFAVTVPRDQFVHLDIEYDTGIR